MVSRGGIPSSRVWSGPGSTVKFSGVNSDRCVCIDGSAVTLAEAVSRIKPRILVITLGVSGGAGILPKEKFQSIYRQMLTSVKKASPKTKIYVQSILPLSDKSVKYYKKITKEAINEANTWIREVCASLSVPYIDTHSLLTGENGYLKQEYQNDEYMHLTSSAYKVILANIKKYIENS
jgi:lysophospholipase L1-like esterase